MTKKEKKEAKKDTADKDSVKEENVKKEKTLAPIEMLNEQLMQKTKEAADFKDKYFRALAEMENVKKRLIQEKKDVIAYSISNIVEDMLGPIDNLENALGFTDNLSEEMKTWAVGFKMILDQFKSALENHGITCYESVGKAFDPHYHEAVELVETDAHDDGIIIEELMKGYRHDKRIVRVAKVKVAKKVKEKK